ncbi:acetylcholine receptor subunit alpha-like 2 [Tubulanus polymorphus]|uniref:acetylcholine receptor subunit alpha-like 2 n=1 Tax=Tubulanus polymorphus TaxID=672921 RepID=UPI003DA61936
MSFEGHNDDNKQVNDNRSCFLLSVLVLYPSSTAIAQTARGLNDEARLIKRLKSEYPDRSARPVASSSNKVDVKVGAYLFRINELNTKRNFLSLNVWMRYGWQDDFLKWDPAQFGGMKNIRLPIKDIWTHDVILFNAGYTRNGLGGQMLDMTALALVTHTGYVTWIPPAQLNALVNTTVTENDDIDCELRFGSWTYSRNLVDVNFISEKPGMELLYYVEHPKYKLVSSTAVRIEKKYPCCEEIYPSLGFHLKLKDRKDVKPDDDDDVDDQM